MFKREATGVRSRRTDSKSQGRENKYHFKMMLYITALKKSSFSPPLVFLFGVLSCISPSLCFYRCSVDVHLGYRSATHKQTQSSHRTSRATCRDFATISDLLRGDNKLKGLFCQVKSIRMKACERPRIYERAESTKQLLVATRKGRRLHLSPRQLQPHQNSKVARSL